MVYSYLFHLHCVYLYFMHIHIHTCLSDTALTKFPFNTPVAELLTYEHFGSGSHNRKNNLAAGELQQGDNNPTTNRTKSIKQKVNSCKAQTDAKAASGTMGRCICLASSGTYRRYSYFGTEILISAVLGRDALRVQMIYQAQHSFSKAHRAILYVWPLRSKPIPDHQQGFLPCLLLTEQLFVERSQKYFPSPKTSVCSWNAYSWKNVWISF